MEPKAKAWLSGEPFEIARRPAADHQRSADPGLVLLVVEVAQGPGLDVQQRDPTLLMVHGEHLNRRVFPIRAPPGAVHDGVLLDSILHPTDLDVLRADGLVHRHDAEAR